MQSSKDLEAFKAEVSWFIKPYTKVEFRTNEDVRLSEEFRNTFPELTQLIEKSRSTILSINSQDYILFAWDTLDGKICGWLNKKEDSDDFNCQPIEKHEILLREIGGIQESFNQPEYSFTNNQNFMFIGSDCFHGIGDWDDYYSMMCEEDQLKELDYPALLVFAYEANALSSSN